jgi:hypothetical protein
MNVIIRFVAATLLSLSVPLVFAPLSWAQGLSLTIGNTVAGQDYVVKNPQFIFRVNGCADLSKAHLSATAEGFTTGARRSIALEPQALPTQPGIYAIGDQWGTDGTWVVAITATCEGATAGAIVPVNEKSFVRARTQLLSHAPSQSDIELALKAYATPVSIPQ